jgi:hypothetical protein
LSLGSSAAGFGLALVEVGPSKPCPRAGVHPALTHAALCGDPLARPPLRERALTTRRHIAPHAFTERSWASSAELADKTEEAAQWQRKHHRTAEKRQLEKARTLELFEQSELLMSRLALVEAQRDDGAGALGVSWM